MELSNTGIKLIKRAISERQYKVEILESESILLILFKAKHSKLTFFTGSKTISRVSVKALDDYSTSPMNIESEEDIDLAFELLDLIEKVSEEVESSKVKGGNHGKDK